MFPEGTEQHQRREKERARELRKSRWWQNRIATSRCHYCDGPLDQLTATMDHIVPISQGGQSTKGNVVPACKPCNSKKRDQTAYELSAPSSMRAELHEIGDDR